ncbi:hypothetical protein LIER_12836 [Lithospermum erythrorhizon]|uniref:Uncharacterized protein n=1 Tax=Lithospermum erythrorhizon TaxID=34254 RepID=A0AAV3PTF4_LITER
MGEEQKIRELEKPKMVVPPLCSEGGNKIPVVGEAKSYSVPASPGKFNCLCAPTTHPGSFRCRYHRNNKPGLARNSMSVGLKLAELARKPTQGSVMC